jgi:SRSO17 transposase
LIGLIGSTKRKTINTITKFFFGEKFNQSSLNRFLNPNTWKTDTLSQGVKKIVTEDHSKCPNDIVFIIIDDMLLEKSGWTMESIGYQYSPKDRKSILCHDLVSCIMVCSCGQIVPMDLRQYVKIGVATEEQREFKTRIELAKQILNSLQLPFANKMSRIVVLFNSWYLCKEIVDCVKQRGWHFVSETRVNRNVRVNGVWMKVGDIGQRLNEEEDQEIVVFGEKKRIAYRDLDRDDMVFMPSLHQNGSVRLICERELDGHDEAHYIVTDMMDISSLEFISYFKTRHVMEEFYKDTKQELGLGEYMDRGHEATNRHWWLVFLVYNALNHLRRVAVSLKDKTVGELCEWGEERCEAIKWLEHPVDTAMSLRRSLDT